MIDLECPSCEKRLPVASVPVLASCGDCGVLLRVSRYSDDERRAWQQIMIQALVGDGALESWAREQVGELWQAEIAHREYLEKLNNKRP